MTTIPDTGDSQFPTQNDCEAQALHNHVFLKEHYFLGSVTFSYRTDEKMLQMCKDHNQYNT